MDQREAERLLKIVTVDDPVGDPIVEPDLDWDDAGIDASGGKDPRSGLPMVLHETPGKDLPEG